MAARRKLRGSKPAPPPLLLLKEHGEQLESRIVVLEEKYTDLVTGQQSLHLEVKKLSTRVDKGFKAVAERLKMTKW